MKEYIQIDDLPHSLITFDAEDFTSRTVLSSMYEPLFYEYKGSYKSFYILDIYKDSESIIYLNFQNSFWSNGELLEAKHFYDTLFYILEKNKKYSSYLDFIVGVEEYLYKEIELKDVGIRLVGNCVELKVKYECDYKKILSAVQFSPVYFQNGKPLITVSNGRFQYVEKRKNYIKVKINKYFMNQSPTIKELNFVYINDLYQGKESYNKGLLSMTCSTFFPFDLIEYYEKRVDFYKHSSNIFFMLELKPELIKYKSMISSYLYDYLLNSKKLVNGLNLSSNYFFNTTLEKKSNPKEILMRDNLGLSKLDLLYADYYPNQDIMRAIIELFEESSVHINSRSLSLKDFITEYNNMSYDICLKLISPLIKSDLDLLISFTNSISTEILKDQYIDLLNMYLEFKSARNRENIEIFLKNHSTIIPIGFGNHIYLKNNNLKGLYIDENDLYKFHDIE